MLFPRLSSRSWFWTLTGLTLAWALLTTQFSGTNSQNGPNMPIGRTMEEPFRKGAQYFLVLGRPLEWAQNRWINLVSHATGPQPTAQNCQELQQENTRLKQEMLIRLDEIDRLQTRMLEAQSLHERAPFLSPANMLPANIYGTSGSVASGYCYLDRGAHDRVAPRQPVLIGYAVLGRVTAASEFTSTAQLLTDRNMKVEARLIRMSPQGSIPIANLCIVRGNGNDTLRCDTIKVQAVAPREGDLLLLSDNEWPVAVQGATIGQVREVRPNEAQPLRYDLLIEPAVTIHSPGQVAIVLMTK